MTYIENVVSNEDGSAAHYIGPDPTHNERSIIENEDGERFVWGNDQFTFIDNNPRTLVSTTVYVDDSASMWDLKPQVERVLSAYPGARVFRAGEDIAPRDNHQFAGGKPNVGKMRSHADNQPAGVKLFITDEGSKGQWTAHEKGLLSTFAWVYVDRSGSTLTTNTAISPTPLSDVNAPLKACKDNQHQWDVCRKYTGIETYPVKELVVGASGDLYPTVGEAKSDEPIDLIDEWMSCRYCTAEIRGDRIQEVTYE